MAFTTRIHNMEPMDASITSRVVDGRGCTDIAYVNSYSGSTPLGDFTYEVTSNPVVLDNPSHADAAWEAYLPDDTYGTQPDGTASGSYVGILQNAPRFSRQKWTRAAGGASDSLTTVVDADS